MRLGTALLAVVGSIVASQALAASSDDTKWINKCMVDNKDEGAKESVVMKYCTCMKNKMSNNETLSITAWEKTHPVEKASCSREAGWK